MSLIECINSWGFQRDINNNFNSHLFANLCCFGGCVFFPSESGLNEWEMVSKVSKLFAKCYIFIKELGSRADRMSGPFPTE